MAIQPQRWQSAARVGRRVPVEWRIVLGFVAVWLVGLAAGLPASVPVRGNLRGLEVHFFWPLAMAAGLQLLLTVTLLAVARWRGTSSARLADAFVMVRQVPLVVVAVFLYFNFKAWAPLVNPTLHDETYRRVDLALAPLLDGLFAVRSAVAEAVPLWVDDWYGWLFFAMFFVSLGVHGLVDPAHRQRQLVLALCLNLCVGGVAYWVAPAVGPFLFTDGLNETVTRIQHDWYAAYLEVRSTGAFPPGYFSIPLGAMPSLHVAHSLLFVLFAARSARWLLVPYLPILAWILVEAPSSGWHYLIDLPFGAAVGLLSYLVATRVVRTPPGGPRPAAVDLADEVLTDGDLEEPLPAGARR